MAKAASALLSVLLGLILYCASVSSARTADNHLQELSHARSLLQQELYADAPAEQDVSAQLAAAGLNLDDLRFDSSLDEKAPPVQLPQQPTPNLLRLLSRMATARSNPAYKGPGLPGPNFPGFGTSRPSSFSAVESAAAFDSAAGGFGAPGSNQPYQLPERFRHYLDADPLHLPSLPETQQQQQQQQPGYTPESAQMNSPEQQQQQQLQQGVITPQISSLITKLAGRGRKFGTNQGGVSHGMLHSSIPSLESAPIGPPSLDASSMQQLAQQPGVLTAGSSVKGGHYSADAATKQLLAELKGLDPQLAKQQFQSLLNRVGGRSASVSEVATRKQYIPRKKATPLAPGGSATADGSSSRGSGQDSTAGALLQPNEQQQKELMDGRDGNSTYGSIVTDNVVLAEPREIDRDAGKVAANAAAPAEQPVVVDILQEDPATFAAQEQETPQTFGQIQDEAAAVATAAAAADPLLYSNRSKLQPVQHQHDSAHTDEQVIAPVGLASNLMPASEGLESGSGAAGSSKGSKKGLHAGAATGIALGAFCAVLLGAGVLLFVQAKKMEQDADSGYAPTAQTEDVELANQKPPAVCVSPAVSMGGAAVGTGSAAGGTAAAGGPDGRFTLNGGGVHGEADSADADMGTPSSIAGWLRDLTAAASGAVANSSSAAAGSRAAPVTKPPAAAGNIRRFTLTSE